jgi:crossover junction endodeoxyribonuclease RusA
VENKNRIKMVLPWPPVELSPNRPGHWARKAKAKKAYRTACADIARRADGGGVSLAPDDVLLVRITFHPKDRRRYDWDNLLARMKAGLDGVADGLGVDDSLFRPTVEVAGFDGKAVGLVVVEVEAG